jgi:hypothetical protein
MPQTVLGRRALVLVLVLYTACALLATCPACLRFQTHLPGMTCDPLQALRVMRWYKEALVEGSSLVLNTHLQYPVGAPLGNFSPLQFQALLYLPLSFVLDNDVLIYNLIWIANLVFTAFGTFVLAWYVCRDTVCAFVGGLLAMLAGPVMLHAQGHLELITLGWFPLFLVAWIRWIDQPGLRRLLTAAGLFVLVALSSAYLAVFATVPAGLYVFWHLLQGGPREVLTRLRQRWAHLPAFVALTLPCLALLFYNQLWSRAHGYAIARSKSEFIRFGSPYYSYFIPSKEHRLGRLLPWDLYGGWSVAEGCSYLGMVTLLLVGWAVCSRASFARRGYWWTLFGLLVLLSFGARDGGQWWQNAGLPGFWLYQGVSLFRLVRVPARFNLCAVICAGMLAAVGLRQLLVRVRRSPMRWGLAAVLGSLAFVDLGTIPFPGMPCPSLPSCYASPARLRHHGGLQRLRQHALSRRGVFPLAVRHAQAAPGRLPDRPRWRLRRGPGPRHLVRRLRLALSDASSSRLCHRASGRDVVPAAAQPGPAEAIPGPGADLRGRSDGGL